VDKGRAVGASVSLTPEFSVAVKSHSFEKLKSYFQVIEKTRDISYLQIVDGRGHILAESDPWPGRQASEGMSAEWLRHLDLGSQLDGAVAAMPWTDNGQGVDVILDLQAITLSSRPTLENTAYLRVGVNFNTALEKNIPRVLSRMILLGVAATGAAVLLLLLWLAYILRPVQELHQGLRAVAAGNLAYQMPALTNDEMGRLAKVFNATVGQLRAAFQRIEELATQDSLTNLANRRHFDAGLAAEAARARRYGHPFGLIVMDLDHFKTVNDRYGHPAGDEVLKAVGQVIKANVRETDLAARIGGEEFAVLLPEADLKEIRAVAEKLRQAVAQTEVQARQGLPPGLRITISAGAVSSSGQLTTPELLMAAADAALYQAKGRGRNMVCVAATN